MISIVVSYYREGYFTDLEQNIRETIGVEYEIIKIHNPGIMGICEAYNKGAAKAKYPYLCFVHEDVKFINKNWGKNLIHHFESDNNCGVIGIAGSNYKSKILSSWWQPAINGIEPKRTNYIQYNEKEKQGTLMYLNPKEEDRSEVATLDGVFLAVKKEVWEEILFDEKVLKGFHAYDLDFSLRAAERYKNYVVYDILLEHYSEGIIDKNWIKQNFLIHVKNRKRLPAVIGNSFSSIEVRQIDRLGFVNRLNQCFEMRMGKPEIIRFFGYSILDAKLFRPNRDLLKDFIKSIISGKTIKTGQ